MCAYERRQGVGVGGGWRPHSRHRTLTLLLLLGPLTGLRCSVLCGRPERSTLPRILRSLPTNSRTTAAKENMKKQTEAVVEAGVAAGANNT